MSEGAAEQLPVAELNLCLVVGQPASAFDQVVAALDAANEKPHADQDGEGLLIQFKLTESGVVESTDGTFRLDREDAFTYVPGNRALFDVAALADRVCEDLGVF